MFQRKCSSYCSVADKELYCDLRMQHFMLTIKSEVTPNAFEFLLSYQFQLLEFLDASHNTAKKNGALLLSLLS